MASGNRMQEKSLGELLLQSGLIQRAQLTHALAEQQRSAEPLGKTLIRLGYVREDQVLQALQGLLVVTFRLATENFAFEALFVQEIIRWREVNELPKMPDYVEGLLNHRDKILPVINLARRLGREPQPITEETRIIIVEKLSQVYGLVVDYVEAVMQLPLEKIESNPTLLQRIDPRFLYGVGKYEKNVITLLHLDPILGDMPLHPEYDGTGASA
jgi:purine-binding chemotaxis protein CheW